MGDKNSENKEEDGVNASKVVQFFFSKNSGSPFMAEQIIINHVMLHPKFWDQKHFVAASNSKEATAKFDKLKDKIFDEIAMMLNDKFPFLNLKFTRRLCYNRWLFLEEYYKRLRLGHKYMTTKGVRCLIKPDWPHFNKMRFLDPEVFYMSQTKAIAPRPFPSPVSKDTSYQLDTLQELEKTIKTEKIDSEDDDVVTIVDDEIEVKKEKLDEDERPPSFEQVNIESNIPSPSATIKKEPFVEPETVVDEVQSGKTSDEEESTMIEVIEAVESEDDDDEMPICEENDEPAEKKIKLGDDNPELTKEIAHDLSTPAPELKVVVETMLKEVESLQKHFVELRESNTKLIQMNRDLAIHNETLLKQSISIVENEGASYVNHLRIQLSRVPEDRLAVCRAKIAQIIHAEIMKSLEVKRMNNQKPEAL